MNQNTWISWITTGIGLALPLAVENGLISGTTATSVASGAAALVPILWGLFIHRDSKVVQTASVVQGVEPIRIDPSAPAALQALAADRSVPTIVPATPAPFVSSTVQQRRT